MEQTGTLILIAIYLAIVGFLGWRGFRGTKSLSDYLLGGRQIHPYVMAMSYGATFISTSAIIGFGGVAACDGMGLMWLTFTNIFVGIFIAFVFFGMRTRSLGQRLDAQTFPELLGRRYQSRFIQGAAAAIVFGFMPLYAGAVLLSAAAFFANQMNMSFETAFLLFAGVVAVYVVLGGIKGVLYTDAFQATVMVVGMIALLFLTLSNMGGLRSAYDQLARIPVPPELAKQGHQGWTSFPLFGSPKWWTFVGSIMAGVSIGVLAQPQLVVRYMTVKSRKDLNRAIPIGALFIFFTVGVAYLIGPLINVHTMNPDPASGRAAMTALDAAGKNVEAIMPLYIKEALPGWFGALFLVTLLSAAMSTLSGQFHTMGTSMGRDLLGLRSGNATGAGMTVTRLATLVGIILSVGLGLLIRNNVEKGTQIVALGTSLFFGLCASAFLPIYVGALWIRGITRAGAVAGMVTGVVVSLFWMVFVNAKISGTLTICERLFGVKSLAAGLTSGPILWDFVDPALVGLPSAILATVLVSLFTRKLSDDHLALCFGKGGRP